MTLTGKEKRELKQRAQKMPDHCHLGKDGLTEKFLTHLNALLDRMELVKLRFEDIEGAQRKALAEEVATAADAQCIAVIGKTIVLYRKKPEDADSE